MRADDGGPSLRAAGRSLLALAIGDCLGAGVEGMGPEEIRIVHAATGGEVRDFRYRPMVWTDDTQQALTLVEAIVRFGYPDPRWVAERWVEMARLGLHRGTGWGFRASIEAYARTRDPRASGRPDRPGDGAAMRIAPAAVALADLPDERFVERLVDVSLITHREVRALAGMLAVAYTARALARSGPYPPERGVAEGILRGLVEWLPEQERRLARHPAGISGTERLHEISEAFQGVLARWGDWPAIAGWIEAFASRARGHPTPIGDGFVTASVVTAVSWALSSVAPLPETLVAAVGFGHDTDTLAAMVGGMAGPGTPPAAIPERWKTFAGYEELRAWGLALNGGASARDLPDVLELERRLTELVRG